MKYLVIVLLLVMTVYMYSFARHNWKKKNKIAALGIVIITLASIILPLFMLFGG